MFIVSIGLENPLRQITVTLECVNKFIILNLH